jgi:hypothetical protein
VSGAVSAKPMAKTRVRTTAADTDKGWQCITVR